MNKERLNTLYRKKITTKILAMNLNKPFEQAEDYINKMIELAHSR
jgi:hypothetical protein